MGKGFSHLIRFLLPEVQINDIRKQYGFVAKKRPEAIHQPATAPTHQIPLQVPTPSNLVTGPPPNNSVASSQAAPSPTYVPKSKRINTPSSSNVKSSTPVSGSVAPVSANQSFSEGRAQRLKKTPVNRQPSRAAASRSKSDGVVKNYELARNSMAAQFIGQPEYIDALFSALMRPIFQGSEPMGVKNTIFILGPDSSGKRFSVELAVAALKDQKALSFGKTIYIDLATYADNGKTPLFMTDIYTALVSAADAIIFDNYEMASTDVINILRSFVTTGSYTMDSRYISQHGVLLDSKGSLVDGAMDTLLASDKYFVFLSTNDVSKISDVFGSKFLESVGDIIKLDAYTPEDVQRYVANKLASFVAKSKSLLDIELQVDPSIASICADEYSPETGFSKIDAFIENSLYKPLAEMKLRSPRTLAGTGMLFNGEEGISISLQSGVVPLSQYMKSARAEDVQKVKEELASVIGLDPVKEYVYSLEQNLQAQQIRQRSGLKASAPSMHMVFSGNPGTGKTTIARIVSRYLKALGVLSGGQLREVSRSDLVGEYVGHTAIKTRSAIESAFGGVLFIDEAYSLTRGDNDPYGKEAIDTLVKAMEDHRDDLVVIIAGYEDEMDDFLKANPGLTSRFPNKIHFPDYSPDEMLQIAHLTAKGKGYYIDENCEESLLRLFEKSQVKGKNDSGNGRLVRNVIESAILNQSRRIVAEQPAELDRLTYEDFNFESHEDFDLEKRLEPIIGLDHVKDLIRNQQKQLVAAAKRREAGYDIDQTQSLNMIFAGNPGTGKTTVARLMAEMLADMGYLKTGQFVEASRSTLVGDHVGSTTKKTTEVFKKALGGVLLIDEAYALSQGNDPFGQEAIDTLVKLIEDYRGEIVVVLAGYTKEMTEFLRSNSGLQSRFPLVFDFPDYTVEELIAIAFKMFEGKGFVLSPDASERLPELIADQASRSNANSGNARIVRNYVEQVLRNQSSRIASSDLSSDDLIVVTSEDLTETDRRDDSFNLEDELEKVIGMETVKNYVRSLRARIMLENERKKFGLPTNEEQSLHMVFTGNPGTGKTMIARTIAKVLYQLGVIRTDKLVETDRAGLVAGYVGQTAIKTSDIINSALDGVLFIDEAYSLSNGHEGDFGKEAIDTIVKLMDDNRDRLVVILAGYTNDMTDFLATNPGLKSRFPNKIDFPDYSVDELMEIAQKFYTSGGYELSPEASNKLREVLTHAVSIPDFGNGRYVRNVYERSLNRQALRLSTDPDLTREELTTIEANDIEVIQ